MAIAIHCPHCHRPVEPAIGELNLDGQVLSVYQCEHCVRPWDFDGAQFDAQFTFALDSDGQVLDPESGEPLPLDDIRQSDN